MSTIGKRPGLRFELVWALPEPTGNAADATEGALKAFVGDRLLWGAVEGTTERGIEWSWVELVEHLAHHWQRLLLEEAPPFNAEASTPLTLRAQSESRWVYLPKAQVEREQSYLWEFMEAHDLSRGLNGAWPTPLWLVREGRYFSIVSDDVRVRRPAEETLGVLSELGSAIVERLERVDDPRAMKAVEEWKARTARSPLQLIAYSTGLTKEFVRQVAGSEGVPRFWGISARGFAYNELQAVARMAGPAFAPDLIRAIVDTVRKLPATPTPALDNVSERARSVLDSVADDKPFEQGYALAHWFRQVCGLRESHVRAEPEHILRRWKVRVREIDLQDSSVDAISTWGPRHGPAVLLNRSGKHQKSDGGRRVTLAHELGHLLVDRSGALPLAEVRGGRTPARVEARAGAFAAEFLVARELAADEVLGSENPKAGVRRVMRKYGVSAEVTAWQVKNSGRTLSSSTFEYLKSLVSEPHLFQ